jgi:hypothetical protein
MTDNRLKAAQVLILKMLDLYDVRSRESQGDKEIWAEAAIVCEWDECFKCHERFPDDELNSVVVARETRESPAEYDYICDECAEPQEGEGK